MSNTKTYVPKCNARSRTTPFGEILTVGFAVKELIEFAEQNKGESGYLNLCIVPRKNPDERSTHSVYLDDWKPTRGSGQQSSAPRRQAPAPAQEAQSADSDSPPF